MTRNQDSFPVFEKLSDELSSDNDKYDSVISFQEICQLLGELHNSEKQCFSNDQHLNHTWLKSSFKVQIRSMDFNETK